jgi:predicted Zn-dependent peptidase
MLMLVAGLLATLPAVAAAPGDAHVNVPVPAHQNLVLPNGLRLILVPRPELPLVAFNLVLRGGARQDPEGREGTAALTADLLTYGAGARDAYAWADTVEGAGGNLDAGAQGEALLVRGQFLARDSALMLQLLSDAVLRPRFAAEEFDKLRARRIEELKAIKDSSPEALMGNYGRALLFATHAYARAVGGSEASLARISRDDVLHFYASEFGADRATLVIAGDFAPAQMQQTVAAAFGGWRRAPVALAPLAEPQRIKGRRVLLVDAPGAAQTYFWLGNVGVARRYPQRAALQISNTAFGGRFGSMLNQELRVKAGLTYSASSTFTRGTVPGEFAIGSFTQTDNAARAIELALATLARLRHDGLDGATLDSARAYLLGQYPLAFETSAHWAAALGDLDLYGLPDSYIGEFGTALTNTDAAAVSQVIASAYPDPDNLAIVLIGDAAKIRAVAAQLGPLAEMPLAAPEFAPPGATH